MNSDKSKTPFYVVVLWMLGFVAAFVLMALWDEGGWAVMAAYVVAMVVAGNRFNDR